MRNLNDPAGRRVGWLLTEIERRAGDRLPEQKVQELLQEVASHLDAAITARLEAGMDPLRAEYETVRTFGPPSEYLNQILRIHERAALPPSKPFDWLVPDRATFVAQAVITLGLVAFILIGFECHLNPAVLSIGSIGFVVLIAITVGMYSFRSRRIQVVPLFLFNIILFAVFCAGFTPLSLDLWEHGGMGFIARREGEKTIENDLAQAKALRGVVAELDHGLKMHSTRTSLLRNRGDVGSARIKGNPGTGETNHGKEAPTIPGGSMNQLRQQPIPADPTRDPERGADPIDIYVWSRQPHPRVTYAATTSVKDADDAWVTNGTQMKEACEQSLSEHEQRIAAIRAATVAPLWSDIVPTVIYNLPCLMVWSGLTCGVNFLFGFAGIVVNLPRFRRRRWLA